MPRYKLLVEYDGTRYSGWQVQQNAKTVQGMLITAAKDAIGNVGQVMGSGRTDAGVHAIGQVVHLDAPHPVDSSRLPAELNALLPSDINVLSAAPADRRFHARHDAVGRSYIYQITRRRTAFGKQYVWWVRSELSLGDMRRASLALTGMHDFTRFADADPDEGSTKVLVQSLEIAEAGDLVLIRICASHFLRKMVRRIVGTLVEIGVGELPVDVVADTLENPGGEPLRYTSPPSGLFLEQVIYKGEAFVPGVRPAIPLARSGSW